MLVSNTDTQEHMNFIDLFAGTGAFSLALENKSSFRSSHPYGSTISIGREASWITESHEKDPRLCHINSPLKRLTDIKTNIIGIGTNFTVNAFYHIIEDCISDYPLNVYEESNKLIEYIDHKGLKIKRKVYRYNQDLAKYRIEKKGSVEVREDLKFYLQKNGTLRYFMLGEATCWIINSEYLNGLRPFLSVAAITHSLSVAAIAAGPSQGSIVLLRKLNNL